MNERKHIRKEARVKRNRIEDKELKNRKITNALLKVIRDYGQKFPQNDIKVFTYVSVNSETDTIHFINELLKDNYSVFCPRVEGNEMNFYRISSMDELMPGFRDIPEPEKGIPFFPSEEDIMVVPGLLFDYIGGRLGYGGGFYDRYLSCHRTNTIGICFSEMLQDEPLHLENWDVCVDMIITDTKIIRVSMKGI